MNRKSVYIIVALSVGISALLFAQTIAPVTISGIKVLKRSKQITESSNVTMTDFRSPLKLTVGDIKSGLLHITLPVSGLEKFYDTREHVTSSSGLHFAWIEFTTDKSDYLSLVNTDTGDIVRFIYATKAGNINVKYLGKLQLKKGWNFCSFKTGTGDTLENYYRKGYIWTFDMIQ
ncbi:MAG: hypothetical protein LBV68_03100 [Spirochaetaceae bacterium]|jgi:hypothetical protein|nr:hypothetical protein [Spirochaetaceae bacterium]